MGEASDDFDVDRLVGLVSEVDDYVLDLKEAIVDTESDSDISEIATDLWEVLDEIEDILGTIDLEEVPEAIDLEALPESVDVADVPEGLFDADENAIELTSVKEAVNLRELWDAVDLTDLYQEKKELEGAVDDVTDHMGDDDGESGDDELIETDIMGDEDDEGMIESVVGMDEGANMEFGAQARQAVVEEKIQDAVVKFREMILTTHEKLHKLYELNQKKLGQPGRQPDSLNPTAASTMPPGPVPESASLRASTVPAQVRHSRVENPRRIYAHRFHDATETGDDSDGESESDKTDAASESQAASEQSEEETAGEERQNSSGEEVETGDSDGETDSSGGESGTEDETERMKLDSPEEVDGAGIDQADAEEGEIILEVYDE